MRSVDAAILVEEFEPELRFVGLLESDFELGAELRVAAGAGAFAHVRSDRGAGTQELVAEHFHFLALFWQRGVEADDLGCVTFGAVPEPSGNAHGVKS